MRKLLSLFTFFALLTYSYAQDKKISEPEWSGEAVVVLNNEVIKLENKKAFIKANASISMYVVGVGNVKSKYMVKGKESSVRFNKKTNLKLIVNAGGNSMNPKTIINIVKLKTKRKKRYYVGSKSGTFSGVKSGDLELVAFKAKKYGDNSYEILIPKIESGEYALIINGTMDWNLFGID